MRPSRLIAAAVVAAVLVACGDDDPATDVAGTTTVATTSPTTSEPPSTTAPATTPEEAIRRWIATGSGDTYLGPCPEEPGTDPPDEGLCSVERGTVEAGTAFGLGPPFSEIVTYVLVEEEGDRWLVADVYSPSQPYDLSDAPAWVDEAASSSGP